MITLSKCSLLILLFSCTAGEQEPIHWGTVFEGLQSNNYAERNCRLQTGHPVCCTIVSANDNSYHKERQVKPKYSLENNSCYTQKVYIPSEYEKEQMDKAKYFDGISNFKQRQKQFVEFICSTVIRGSLW